MKKMIGWCLAKIHDDEGYQKMKTAQSIVSQRGYKLIVYEVGFILATEQGNANADSLFMINFEMLSGLVIDAENIHDRAFMEALVAKAKEYEVPVVVLNSDIPDCHCIRYSVTNAFKEMLLHMIEEHNCKEFVLLNLPSVTVAYEPFVEIYKQLLQEKNLEIKENSIFCLEKNKEEADEYVEQLIKTGLPEVIVCTNDKLAIHICHLLKKSGKRVPEDVYVTGMDGIIRGEIHQPLLATCVRQRETTADKVVDTLESLLNGQKVERMQNVDSLFRRAQSCSCHCDTEYDTLEQIRSLYERIDTRDREETLLYEMESELLQSKNLLLCGNVLRKYLFPNSVVCCRSQFMDNIFFEGTMPLGGDMEEAFTVLMDNRVQEDDYPTIVLGELIPDLEKETEKNSPLVVFPLRYEKRNFGYVVLCMEDYDHYTYSVEKYGLKLNSSLGKYCNDQKIRFANQELLRANEHMLQMQVRDGLTGLYNSQGFLSRLEEVKKISMEEAKKIILLCIDVDRLGHINDVYGHSEGDLTIKTLARMIQDGCPEDYVCGRLGSDEFAIAFATKEDEEFEVKRVVGALSGRVISYNAISNKEYSLEINYGYFSVYPAEDTNMKDVLDEAMFKKRSAKNTRRSSVHLNEERDMQRVDESVRQLVHEVIDGNMFKYAFQPIVDARTGEIYAYEALMRTNTQPMLSPLAVLKYATLDKKLYDIERATLNNVFAILKKKKDELEDKKIFINSIPGYHLDETDFAKLKRRYKDLFDRVVIEITEQTEMEDEGVAVLKRRSSDVGFEVAIDDFGSGYSNTSSLLRFLPHYVKIDRMLITGIHEDTKRQHFVKNIIDFAHDNGFMALAEGVETLEELKAVIHLDVDLIQGYYTAKPSFDIVPQIKDELQKEIISANVKAKDKTKKKMYVVNQEKELLLMPLALEGYTGIVVSKGDLTIIGNPDFEADMVIRVKEDSDCRLTIRNVRLAGRDAVPCIDIGKNSELTLIVEDTNEIKETGIHVPKSATLRLIGNGDLRMDVKGIESYAIGNGLNKSFGHIISKMTGGLFVKMEGASCIGIGGGIASKDSAIEILAGKVEMEMAGMDGIGIGYAKGYAPIVAQETGLRIDIKMKSGVAIGNLEGDTDMVMRNVGVTVTGSGTDVSGIGSLQKSDGSIIVENAKIAVNICGYRVGLMGVMEGDLACDVKTSRIILYGEGTEVLGIGSGQRKGSLSATYVTFETAIRSAMAIPFGFQPEKMSFTGGQRNILVNDETVEGI